MSANPDNRLLIRNFESRYLVPQDHPAPQRIQAKLDEVAVHTLAQTLVSALSPWFANPDSSLWFIQRLDVELAIDMDNEQDRLVRAWAIEIAKSMAITIQGSSDEENVLYFPNRAAYLASFLSDVSDNRAWGKWYYNAFQGLKQLPASALVRTVVCEQPNIGEEALRQLNETGLKNLIRSLTAADARLILGRVAEASSDSGEFSAFESAWNTLAPSLLEYPDFGGEWQNALRLYLAASQGTGGGMALKTAVSALLRLTNLLMDSSGIRKEALVEVLTQGETAALYTLVGATNAESLSPLLRCPSNWVKEVGLTMMACIRGSAPGTTEEFPAQRFTPFGGIFLLLPILDEWPLAQASHDWPDWEETPSAAILRLLILAKCCGRPRAQGVFHDNLIRDFLGIPPGFSIEMLGDWQNDFSVRHLQAFLGALTDWLSQRGAISGNKLILYLTASVAVLLDGARGIWLAAEEFAPSCPKNLPEALSAWMERVAPKEKSLVAPEAPLLLCGPELFFHAQSSFPETRVLRFEDDRVKPLAEEDSVLAEILVRLDKLPDDLAHLSLPESWGLTPEFDHTLSVAAQSLMRSFAWRLPGFAHANLPYLYCNFLDFSASLEDEADRRVVRVGRPPLHLILNFTGIARGTYRLNWLDERPFALFPEQ